MNVAVVMAFWDSGCPHRAAAYAYTRAWYQALGLPVHVDATRSRAAATNATIGRIDAQVIVQADPDSILRYPSTLMDAVALAAQADGIVVPHDRYLYLQPDATADVIAGRRDAATTDRCEFVGDDGVGNVVVFSRQTWKSAGGFDERFREWGGDDAAFRYAAEAFVGPLRRIPGDMLHLWHPRQPQSVPGHPGYEEQFAILAEYRDAAAVGPQAVRELVYRRADP